MNERKGIQRLLVVLAAIGLLLGSGCSNSAIIPREKISEGDQAILKARESNASVNAPIELRTAEDKLAEAKTALAKKDYAEATRLAEQALVDADFAMAKGESEKAKKKAEEVRRSIKALREEVELLSRQITLQGGK